MNPFFHGQATPPERFVGRSREIRRIERRALDTIGQSTVVVGEPRVGKSSLLHYTARMRPASAGAAEVLPLFQLLDGQSFQSDEGPGRFWERALIPVAEYARGAGGPELDRAVVAAHKSVFKAGELNEVFKLLARGRARLVLLIDEIDALARHPLLGRPDLFGLLRSLASRPDLGLCVVGASRLSLSALHQETTPPGGGSPYLNFAEEVVLGALAPADANRLLRLGEVRFQGADHLFLRQAAGGHPFLLQAGGAALWEAYEADEPDPWRRRTLAAAGLRKAADRALGDTWACWPDAHKVVFLTVAAAQLQREALKRDGVPLDVESALGELRSFGPEIEELTERGYLVQTSGEGGPPRIGPEALLWWLADELVRAVRDPASLERWLERHQVTGGLSQDQRSALKKTMGGLVGLIGGGAKALIEAAAKAAGDAYVKGLLT